MMLTAEQVAGHIIHNLAPKGLWDCTHGEVANYLHEWKESIVDGLNHDLELAENLAAEESNRAISHEKRIQTLEAKLAAAREGLQEIEQRHKNGGFLGPIGWGVRHCIEDYRAISQRVLTSTQDDRTEALMEEQGLNDDIIKAAQAWRDAHLDGSDSQEVTRRRGYLYDRVRRLDQHQKRGGV